MCETFDATIIGFVRFSNGIGRNTIGALDYLSTSLKINYVKTRPEVCSLTDVPLRVQELIAKNDRSPSNVAILYDTLDENNHLKVPNSKIKIAYSVYEADAIYPQWVSIINNYFDAVFVPDPFLITVYKNSGVNKPLFCAPHFVYMDDFLAKPLKTKRNPKFTFGLSCRMSEYKNYNKLIDAFINEFGHSKDVFFIFHTVDGFDLEPIKNKIKPFHNIKLIARNLSSADYGNFMASLDCYCLISRGEGFSLTPREAMALGIPCILSNNTAHKTICDTGLVYAVPSDILEINKVGNRTCGHNFNCTMKDVQKALREVYSNYDFYLKKASAAREWVKQYHGLNLKNKYINLIKPTRVILGNENKVTDEYLMTSDRNLYEKYFAISNNR